MMKKSPMKKPAAKKPAMGGKKPAMVTAKNTKGTTAAAPMKGGFSKMMKSTDLGNAAPKASKKQSTV
jgi:hypothetical protein